MSADRIDVLAVMDREITTLAHGGYTKTADEMRAARAAVAELIEALRNAPCYCEDGEGGERDIVCDRCAALARIVGEP